MALLFRRANLSISLVLAISHHQQHLLLLLPHESCSANTPSEIDRPLPSPPDRWLTTLTLPLPLPRSKLVLRRHLVGRSRTSLPSSDGACWRALSCSASCTSCLNRCADTMASPCCRAPERTTPATTATRLCTTRSMTLVPWRFDSAVNRPRSRSKNSRSLTTLATSVRRHTAP